MKNSVCSQLSDCRSAALACKHEIILKITCNKIVSVLDIYRCVYFILLIIR